MGQLRVQLLQAGKAEHEGVEGVHLALVEARLAGNSQSLERRGQTLAVVEQRIARPHEGEERRQRAIGRRAALEHEQRIGEIDVGQALAPLLAEVRVTQCEIVEQRNASDI